MRKVIEVAVDHHFAVPLREGFDYITDSANWPECCPGLVGIEPASRWRRPGDYRLVVSYRPRRGPRGFLDRTIFRRSVKRALKETVENIEGRFEERGR